MIIYNQNTNQPVTFFFLDDAYVETGQSVAFGYGGFFVDINKLNEIKNNIEKVKLEHNIDPWIPVKWNFSDDLKKFFMKYSGKGDQGWKQIKEKSKEIRLDLLKNCREISIIFSVFAAQKGYEKNELKNWMIENLFQRIGLNMQATSLNIIVCDFEHEKSKAKQILEKEYFNAYYKAENYLSGPLQGRGAFPSLTYSSTYYNPFLQLADIIVGCMRELVKGWLSGNNKQSGQLKLAIECFQHLKDSFVKKPTTGEIFRFGIISRPKDFESYLKELLS